LSRSWSRFPRAIPSDEDALPIYFAVAVVTILFFDPAGVAGVGVRKLWDR
jgi:hypothetical protein